MLMIFPGMWQKPVTPFCYAEWNKARYPTTHKLKKIVRRANSQRHTVPSSGSQNSKKLSQKPTRSLTCNYFNLGACSHLKKHETRGMLYKHICAACFAVGKSFNHPEIECRSKNNKNSKNK